MVLPYDDTYFMKKALQEAEYALDAGEVPVGAVIVVQDRIIARAHNLTEKLNDVTALYWSQIGKIVYGAKDLQRGCGVMGTTLHPKTKITGGILKDDAARLLQEFFAKKRT